METLPASTMIATNDENSPTYETIPSQAPSAAPYWNTPVPTFLQTSPVPAYTASPSTQVWNIPTITPQWTVATVVAPNTGPSSLFHQTFLKSKPKALGIVLIVSAILEIGLGICLGFTLFNITLPSGIPFWGSVFYIIAGSLTITAWSKPNICMVRGSLSLNIISSIFSFIAVILNIIDLGTVSCYYFTDYNSVGYHNYETQQRRCMKLLNGAYAVQSFLLIINVLIFCVSLVLSIFGCRSVSKVSSNTPQVFLIQNDVVVSMNPSTVPVTVPGFPQQFAPANAAPPPYVFQEVQAKPMS